MENNNKPKIIYGNAIGKAGLYSDVPIALDSERYSTARYLTQLLDKEPQDVWAEDYYKNNHNWPGLTAYFIGLESNKEENYVAFTSEDKKEVELWTLGVISSLKVFKSMMKVYNDENISWPIKPQIKKGE